MPDLSEKHLLELACMNTADALDEYWSRPSVHESYFGPGRLKHYQNVVDYAAPLVEKLGDKLIFLDAGCGPGKLVSAIYTRFPDRVATVAGVDYARSALRWAAWENPKARFINADITHEIPFSDGSFDITFCSQSLEHITEWRRALSEMHRVTRGYIIITIPNGETDTFPAHVNRWTLEQVKTDFADYGLIDARLYASHIPDIFITLDAR